MDGERADREALQGFKTLKCYNEDMGQRFRSLYTFLRLTIFPACDHPACTKHGIMLVEWLYLLLSSIFTGESVN